MKARRGERGQALVEFAILSPVLLLFVLLTIDVGRAYWQAIDAAGAARAGVRMGIISDTSDIGGAIRDEPNSGIPNTLAAWGSEGPGTTWGTCTTASGVCGDPGGCTVGSFSGRQVACFAVRSCALSSGGDLGTCTSYGPWGARPVDGTGHGLQIQIVIKFSTVTPALAQIAGAASQGVIMIVQSATGEELYF
ncbi:MAG TPA: TadE/TadG family type IV pilus assembly protein [Candidatus Dormibacteraeota bacterium]|nr:TadE/TadG family type IV pilus assembly protein [Candidatus Dormibacteraeota bacterium]